MQYVQNPVLFKRLVAQPVKSEYRGSGYIKEMQCKGVNWFQPTQDRNIYARTMLL
jgi:hypothetical protein